MSGAVTVKTRATIAGPVDPVGDLLFKYVTPKAGNKPSSVRFTGPTTVAGGSTSVPTAVDLGTSTLTFAGATTIGPDVTMRYGTVVVAGSTKLTSSTGHPFAVTDLTTTGVLTGTGTIVGDVVNTTGRVIPGTDGRGSLRIDGILVQKSGGELVERLLKNAAPLLTIDGSASLKGHLLLENGYLPALGARRALLKIVDGPVSTSFSCVATTGQGTTGRAARHWKVAQVIGVTAVKGRKASC